MPRPRTWTDRQLADAVASAKTWVEVAHKLGSTSASPTTRHLRQHAKRLRLDTRHLPARTVVLPSTGSPPPLNEDAVVAAVTTSGRWIDVLGKLQVSRSSASYRRVQRIACVAGVSLLGSVPEQDTFPELPLPIRHEAAPSTIDKGTRSEGAVLAALLQLGYNVLLPFGVARYDLVIETTAGFKRVQCKTAHFFEASITFSTISKGKRYNGDVDYFGVHEPASGHVYMVPIEAVGRRRSVYLRVNGKPGGRDAKQFQIA